MKKSASLFVFCVVFISIPLKSDTFVPWSADENPEKWHAQAKETIDNILNRKINKNVAKNLIIFIGDGMGVSTVTSGRIRKGQKKGKTI